ncbi:protein regulator of cytokinesis 1-like [Drosophila nasuta]|uniref:Protein regulator of cytokinesis 1-like n=1 Tax=Drosophila albomicans TaxID=7291 RepID=A0A6P8WU00_DROAB|nr:protein regulator of cytokinesis 1-like [Drosophila albomicans]XP_060651514.1 protein regulator of cytokinesis 1-like [Drosophila nasuta]
MSVDTLCKIWALKLVTFQADISSLLKKSKRLAEQLNNTTINMENSQSLTQDKLRLHELMVHLTEELQRHRDEASAKKRLHEWQKSLDRMRAKIRKISHTLGEVGLVDMAAIDKLCDTEDYSQPHYEVLSQELQRCEALRHDNLSILIDRVWSQIYLWFNMTLQHSNMKHCKQDCASVELLELLEQKVIDLQTFYHDHSDIFQLYAKRDELWTRMAELDHLAGEPTRYRNRGGQLLREEKERNYIQGKLPEIEAKLGELVRHFEESEGRQFTVFNVEIMHKITMDWEEYNQTKANEIQRRKQSMFQTTTPRLIRGSSTTSSLVLNGKTPQRAKSGKLSARGLSSNGSTSSSLLSDRKPPQRNKCV